MFYFLNFERIHCYQKKSILLLRRMGREGLEGGGGGRRRMDEGSGEKGRRRGDLERDSESGGRNGEIGVLSGW